MTTKKKKRLTPIPEPARRKPAARGRGAAPAAPAAPNLDHIAEPLRPLAFPLAELAFMVGNAVKHPEKQVSELRASLRTFQQVEPLVVNKRETPPVVIGGNGRLQALLAEGFTHGAVCFVDLDRAKANALSLTLNRTPEGREWDATALDLLLRDVNTANEPCLDALLADLAAEVGVVPAEATANGAATPPEEMDFEPVDEDGLDLLFKAPFPWFGGKARIAKTVWQRFGSVSSYVEPFFGSGAVFLNRPQPVEGVETVNDADGLLANFWRAVQADPDAVAHHADWPVNECVPAGTMIATPAGNVPVESVCEGMTVWGERNGRVVETTVVATKVSESAEPFIRVGPLLLTGNHPVWTQEKGYVKATDLESWQHVAMICNHGTHGSMCDMRQDLQGKVAGREILLTSMHGHGQSHARKAVCGVRQIIPRETRQQGPKLLLRELRSPVCLEAGPQDDASERGKGERSIGEQRGSSAEARGLAALAGKPDLRPRCETQVRYFAEESRLSLSEFQDDGAASDHSAENVDGTITGLGIGADSQDLYARRPNTRRQAAGASALLVSPGPCGAETKNRSRSGRPFSPFTQGCRRTAGRGSDRAGVAYLEVHQPKNPNQPRQGGCGDHGSRSVYNFQTLTGNYFAAGILVHNCDLHARHAWLVAQKDTLQARLEGDPEFFDAKVAGWWCWGMASWIGSGFCSGNGPWQVQEMEDGTRQLVHLSNAGRGVNRQRVHLADAGQGVNRQLVHLGDAGQGVNRQLVHLGTAGQGQPQAGRGECGLLAWMQALSERLRRVRVCCGDWTRVSGGDDGDALKHLLQQTPCGVFLDPPYADTADRQEELYRVDSSSVAHAVRQWAVRHGNDDRFRICLAGYEGEHAMPADWRVVGWKTAGGYGSQGEGRGKVNARRERLWFSPHCLGPA